MDQLFIQTSYRAQGSLPIPIQAQLSTPLCLVFVYKTSASTCVLCVYPKVTQVCSYHRRRGTLVSARSPVQLQCIFFIFSYYITILRVV